MTANVIPVDVDQPDVRALVMFRNSSQPCLVIRQDKARSDAKVFREIAASITGTDRGLELAEWLNDLAGRYERMENPGEEPA